MSRNFLRSSKNFIHERKDGVHEGEQKGFYIKKTGGFLSAACHEKFEFPF